MGDYPNCPFVELQLTFCKKYRKVQNDEQALPIIEKYGGEK